MNLTSSQELEDILQAFIRVNGYVSERPVDFNAAVQKIKEALEINSNKDSSCQCEGVWG